jgi:hypothetical protein
MSDFFFVPLEGTALRLLATPSHPYQDSPDMIGMIVHAKLFSYLFGDAL